MGYKKKFNVVIPRLRAVYTPRDREI
jgi:hypothetical protein